MTDSCKYRFRLYIKKNQAYPPKIFPKYNLCLKYPEEVGKNCLYKVWEKNAHRIYAEIVFACFKPLLSQRYNFTTLTNERIINRIVDKTFIIWRA